MSLPAPFAPDLKVLVLAGSDHEAPRSRASNLPLSNKAFVTLRGRLLIEYVLDVLDACGLGRRWILGDAGQLARVPARYRFVPIPQPEGADFLTNLAAARAALDPGDQEPVFVVFGDHPLNSEVVVDRFLADCGTQLDKADLFHGLALQAQYREYAPWFSRTSAHTRQMTGRASGLSLVIPSRLHGLSVLPELYRVRKQERIRSFTRLVGLLVGLLGADAPRGVVDSLCVFAAKEMEKRRRGSGRAARAAGRLESWFAARVPVQRLERYAARVLGAERGVRMIPIAHGGIAIDVDFADELEVLERNWDAIRAIAARQDAALLAARTSPEP